MVLEWLLARGCPADLGSCRQAARSPEVIEWLDEYGVVEVKEPEAQ